MATEHRESTHRWNVEETEAGVRICRGEHEKAAACEWEEYVLAAEPPVVVPSERERNGLDLIAVERRRQVEAEGWTPEHDDTHGDGQLAEVAAALALNCTSTADGFTGLAVEKNQFGYARDEWGLVEKHRYDPIRCLTIAGALIAAEIDRLQRSEYAVGSPDRGGKDE